ncbi:hypothetical protein HHI36_000021 [Cryptolaemus montrouzieri]|uniref:SWIM-type domain-containing protein n=1 Tax=Cryptolaemus montrouzieri TaxID=559131 RepID=A0ABD2P421_9CUCU
MSTALNGFKKCGIWPYNSSVFSKRDFAPSLMTDIRDAYREDEVTTATTTSNIGLAAAAAPLFNSHILSPTVTEAQPIIVTEPNCIEVILHYNNIIPEAWSSRLLYGDDAISYVQLKREGNICTVKCKICSEHNVHAKLYAVTLIVDEDEEKVTSIQCPDCVAAQGGCNHAIALLMWVHRLSEEPSCT